MRIAICDDNTSFLNYFKPMLIKELELRSIKDEIETYTKA